jgi:hypothetical protein
MDMVYRKALRLNTGDVAAKGVGGIVNLQSNDVKKLERLPIYMFSIWEGPMQVRVMDTLGLRPGLRCRHHSCGYTNPRLSWLPAMLQHCK